MKIARVLTIAGSDSGGGAGIQADVRTITNLGGHAMTAITAITAQNSRGVTQVEILSANLVMGQIKAVADDFGLDAIKIGMLGSAQTATVIADYLANVNIPVIFDPVMVATSGAELADEQTIAAFRRIMPLSAVITPNLPEYERLGGVEAVHHAGVPFLVKGGHGADDILVDSLLDTSGEIARWKGARIDTVHSHGTGCTLSSAIATFLAQGDTLEAAIGKAREYVRASLVAAPGIGAGHGPMGVPET